MAPPRLSLPPTRCPSVQIQKRLPARRRQADRDRLPPSLPPSRRRSVCVCAWWLAHRRAPCRRRRSRRAISGAGRHGTARRHCGGGTAAAATPPWQASSWQTQAAARAAARAAWGGCHGLRCAPGYDMQQRERERGVTAAIYARSGARGGHTSGHTVRRASLSLRSLCLSLCSALPLSPCGRHGYAREHSAHARGRRKCSDSHIETSQSGLRSPRLVFEIAIRPACSSSAYPSLAEYASAANSSCRVKAFIRMDQNGITSPE